jgi:hypothetical protein
MVTWDHVTHAEVLRAIQEYDRLGPEAFFAEHGFARTTTYELLPGAPLPAQGDSGHGL